MPEPNIRLNPGAELTVTILGLPEEAPSFDAPAPSPVPQPLRDYLRAKPFEVTKWNGRPARDIVNLAFDGSAAELVDAFHMAGWSLAAPLTAKAMTREYRAYSAKAGFPNAPAHLLRYQDQPPVFVFEKSLNDVTMRHHIRIWKVDDEGSSLWLGAATHDIGIGFDPLSVKLTHRIERKIDLERGKVANDLTFSGCSSPAAFIDRPDAVSTTIDSNSIQTDGRLAFLKLNDCRGALDPATADDAKPVGTLLSRTARRMVLETRQYVERENAFFWTYRVVKWSWAARKNHGLASYDDEQSN